MLHHKRLLHGNATLGLQRGVHLVVPKYNLMKSAQKLRQALHGRAVLEVLHVVVLTNGSYNHTEGDVFHTVVDYQDYVKSGT